MKRKSTRIVIAETYEHYLRACAQWNWRVDSIPYINSVGELLRYPGPYEPIFLGKYWENPQYQLIERAMKSRGIVNSSNNRRVEIK